MHLPLLFLVAFFCILTSAARAQDTWSTRTSGTTANLWSVAQADNQWVAVGEQGTLLTSSDGAAWTARTSGFPTRWLVAVGYGTPNGSGLWAAVGEGGLILTSPDAVTWTPRKTTGTRLNAVAWGNGTFVAADDNGSTYFSLDGTAWNGPFFARSSFIRGLVYGAPHFVMTGLNGIQTTYDGQSSTARVATTPQLQGAAYGRRLYLATGGANTFTSRDAVTWTQQPATTTVAVQAATFFNNQFVAVGNSGAIATTFDGTAWTNRVSGTTQTLLAVAASADSAVAVGFGGTILQSAAASSAPAVVFQPAPVTEVPGGNVAFTVTARGSSPLTYQWRRDGTNLPGATTDTLFLPAVTNAQTGNYTCVITNSAGSIVSAPAALTLIASFPTPNPVDLSFALASPLNVSPRTAAVQSDGKILIGGNFLLLNEGQAQFGLARLTANGALDTTFKPGSIDPNGEIQIIVLQPNGKILIGGTFVSINGVARNRIARLNADGSLDPSFVPAYSGDRPLCLVVTPGDQLLVSDVRRIDRLNSDGTLDPTWSFVRGSLGFSVIEEYPAVALQTDGRIIIGDITGSGIGYVSIRRLNANGSNDPTFPRRGVGEASVGVFRRLGALRVLPDGRIMAAATGGGLATIRLTSSGEADPTFAPISNRVLPVSAVSFTSDGRTWIAGNFTSIDGVNRNQLARLRSDGTLDSTFNPGAGVFAANNSAVASTSLIALEDGRAIVLGDFTRINTTARAQVALLNSQTTGGPNIPVILPLSSYYRELRAGEGLTVQVNAIGSPTMTYGGSGSGRDVTGIATVAIPFPSALLQQSGQYSVTATNAAGTSTTQLFYVRLIPSAPAILAQPVATQTNAGRSVTLSVTSVGSNPLTYQWFKNGAAITGATSATVTYANTQPADSGDYTVVIRNSLGFATSETIRLGVDETPRFVSIATRAQADGVDRPLIAGFAVIGPGNKRVLVRGIGPTLTNAPFNLTGVLLDPVLTVYNSAGTAIYTNDDWGSSNDPTGVETAVTRLGAFPLTKPSADAAGILSLAPDSYTAVVTGKNNAIGVALVEVYEDDNVSSRLIGLSSRAFVGSGAAVAIPGIVVRGGGAPKKILIRAVGPGLNAFGVPAVLADPTLTITDSAGTHLATNDNWETSANLPDLIAATAKTTFPLVPGSRDAALLVTLPTGGYTVQVSGNGGASGNALIEVYELP